MSLVESKSLLAKLLAEENLTVEHRKVATAYFEVKNRVLVCPILKDMPADLYDLLMGHEVGHALFTPPQGWHDALEDTLPGFKSFLNVVEDARIEKFIKNKFPGIRGSFYKGYKNLFERNFFNTANRDLTKYPLIDRINLHFKLGALQPVTFGEEEEHFVEDVADCETWDDVVRVAQALYDYSKEESRTQQNQDLSDFDLDDLDELDDVESLDDGEDSVINPLSGEAESDSDSDGSDKPIKGRFDNSFSQPYENLDPVSETDRAFRNNERALIDDQCLPVAYTYLPKFDMTNRIIGHKQVYKNMVDSLPSYVNSAGNLEKMTHENFSAIYKGSIKEFNEKNSRYINHLVQEFELRKNAKQFARAQVSKTGELDMKKIASYRFTEDMFKRVTSVPNGKNHGLLMFLDLSGSMRDSMVGCIEQVLIMTAFCRKVNIPFRVFGFSDSNRYGPEVSVQSKLQPNPEKLDLCFDWGDNYFRLREYLTSKMSRSEYTLAVQALLNLSKVFKHRSALPESEYLNGTPLNEAIIASIDIANDFRRQYKLEVLTTMFVTDGESNNQHLMVYEMQNEKMSPISIYNQVPRFCNYRVNLTDRKTKKSITISRNENLTTSLAELAKNATGANFVGFFIGSAGTTLGRVVNEVAESLGKDKPADAEKAEARKNKFFVFQNVGFDSFFVVPGGVELQANNATIEADSSANKAQLKKAFSNALSSRATSRQFLLRFCNTLTHSL